MATLEQSELDIALERLTPQWLAGFFDGEGCISVVRLRYGIPSLAVTVSQAEYNILSLIGMKFCADKKPYKKYAKLAKRQGWCLAFYGRGALSFLETIRPHVILKRKLVEWAIEMAQLHGTPGGNRRNPKGKLNPEAWKRREELMVKVRTENNSGKSVN